MPLLERRRNSSGADEWQPRPAADLNREFHKHYGVPIEFERKMEGLGAICRALNRGDLIHAQIATLHLQIPEPPVFTKAAQIPDAEIDLVRELRISGFLKQDWDPQKHPRWPTGSPDSVGGQFAPAGADTGNAATEEGVSTEQDAQVIPAQLRFRHHSNCPELFHFPPRSCPPLLFQTSARAIFLGILIPIGPNASKNGRMPVNVVGNTGKAGCWDQIPIAEWVIFCTNVYWAKSPKTVAEVRKAEATKPRE